MADDHKLVHQIDRDGFAVSPGVFDRRSVLNLERALAPLLQAAPVAGIRNLVAKVPAVRELAGSAAIRALVEAVLGHKARLVRSILFNKSEEVNWQVAWHQDLSIAVRAKHEIDGFVSWSMKDGVPHVQPPNPILQRMLTLRIHLDAADETNGALCVSPGSHTLGKLRSREASAAAKRQGEYLCTVNAGDILLFRPLILHCSHKATSQRQRRVVHLEFSGTDLPEPLLWAEDETGTEAQRA